MLNFLKSSNLKNKMSGVANNIINKDDYGKDILNNTWSFVCLEKKKKKRRREYIDLFFHSFFFKHYQASGAVYYALSYPMYIDIYSRLVISNSKGLSVWNTSRYPHDISDLQNWGEN